MWQRSQQPRLPFLETQAREAAWFAVRCVFACGRSTETGWRVYEERITLWHACSVEDAVDRAETEARAYAATTRESTDTYLGLAQVYELSEEPGDGAAVFSLLRACALPAEDYLGACSDSGSARWPER